jgi:hypothetical protein
MDGRSGEGITAPHKEVAPLRTADKFSRLAIIVPPYYDLALALIIEPIGNCVLRGEAV